MMGRWEGIQMLVWGEEWNRERIMYVIAGEGKGKEREGNGEMGYYW